MLQLISFNITFSSTNQKASLPKAKAKDILHSLKNNCLGDFSIFEHISLCSSQFKQSLSDLAFTTALGVLLLGSLSDDDDEDDTL